MSAQPSFNLSTHCYKNKHCTKSTSILQFDSLKPPLAFRSHSQLSNKTQYIPKPRSKLEFDKRLLTPNRLDSVPVVNQRVSVDDLPESTNASFNLSTSVAKKDYESICQKAFSNSSRYLSSNQNAVMTTRTKKWSNFLVSRVHPKNHTGDDSTRSKSKSDLPCSSCQYYHDGVLLLDNNEEMYSCCSGSRDSRGCRSRKRFSSWSYV
ncbi:hypothetical protein GEMRC1_007450 [Eukaryota sp. GEM-RC1]